MPSSYQRSRATLCVVRYRKLHLAAAMLLLRTRIPHVLKGVPGRDTVEGRVRHFQHCKLTQRHLAPASSHEVGARLPAFGSYGLDAASLGRLPGSGRRRSARRARGNHRDA